MAMIRNCHSCGKPNRIPARRLPLASERCRKSMHNTQSGVCQRQAAEQACQGHIASRIMIRAVVVRASQRTGNSFDPFDANRIDQRISSYAHISDAPSAPRSTERPRFSRQTSGGSSLPGARTFWDFETQLWFWSDSRADFAGRSWQVSIYVTSSSQPTVWSSASANRRQTRRAPEGKWACPLGRAPRLARSVRCASGSTGPRFERARSSGPFKDTVMFRGAACTPIRSASSSSVQPAGRD